MAGKKRQKPEKKKKKPKGRGAGRRHYWACARVPLDVSLDEDGQTVQPWVTLCVERPKGLVLQMVVERQDEVEGLAPLLRQAIETPLIGAPRIPDRVIVESADLAAELDGLAADLRFEVAVGPTPEIRRIASTMIDHLEAEDSTAHPFGRFDDMSFLEGGATPAQIRALFEAVRDVYVAKPWKRFTESPLRVDAPALGIEGGCLVPTGELGSDYGFLLFFTDIALGEFLDAIEGGFPPVFPTLSAPVLAVGFDRLAGLPKTMRREALAHGWPVAGPKAYPWFGMHEPAGEVPLSPSAVAGATAVARALAGLPRPRQATDFVAQRATAGEVTAEVTFPYFDGQPAIGTGAAFDHELSREMMSELYAYAMETFGEAFLDYERTFVDPEYASLLSIPYAVFHFEIDKRPVIDWYFDDGVSQLDEDELHYLECEKEAWLSVWEVVDVNPGSSLTLRDLLMGEERTVDEVSASQMLTVRSTILGRVVDLDDDLSVLIGVYPRPLPPEAAQMAIDEARRRGRSPEAVTRDRLRRMGAAKALIEAWEGTIAGLEELAERGPELRNTDGDPLLATTDRFVFDAADREAIIETLSALPNVDSEEDDEGRETSIRLIKEGNAMHPSWETTLLAHIRVGPKTLEIDTNSIARADDTRERVKAALGDRARFQVRSHSDPTSDRAGEVAGAADELTGPEIDAATLEMKQKHYASWIDQPLAALDGKSPRQAAKTKRGRDAVDLLLRDIEFHEGAVPEAQRVDLGDVRKLLRLD